MSKTPFHPEDEWGLGLPPGMEEQLRRMHTPPRGVPHEVDEAILAHARTQLGRRRRLRQMIYWSAAGVSAAAAMLVIAFRLAMPAAYAPQASRVERVTILNAFELARQLDSGARPSTEWDANNDGVVDRRDVDAIAHSAVRLEQGTL